MKYFIIYFFSIFSLLKGFGQKNSEEKHFQKVYAEFSFLPLPKSFFIQKSFYDDYITEVNLYTKISNEWYGGINSYHLFLVLDGADILKYTQPFFITSLFTRHYTYKSIFNIFLETSFGVGNLCQCRPSSPNIIAARGLYRLDKLGFHFGSGIGLDIKLNEYITLKPNLKLFYLLNKIQDKNLHIRPFLTFQFPIHKKPPPIIYNPRF